MKTDIYENVVTGDVVTIKLNSGDDENVILKNAIKNAKKSPGHLKSPAFNNIKNWEKIGGQG